MITSKKKKKSIKELTDTISKSFHEDCKYLNCLDPTFEPRATEHIKGMINMISNLLNNKHAYVKKKACLFFCFSFKKYGKLSNKNSDQLIAGSRVEISKYKNDPLDFIFGNLLMKMIQDGIRLGEGDDLAGIWNVLL